MNQRLILLICLGFSNCLWTNVTAQDGYPNLMSGAADLNESGDIASLMVDGIDKFLLRKLNSSIRSREKFWKRDFSSHTAYDFSMAPNRKRLKHILGVRDVRADNPSPRYHGSPAYSALVGQGSGFKVYRVSWPAFGDVNGEGLLLVPENNPVANIVALPDCNVLPEQLAGLIEGVEPAAQFARRLAENGCRVVIPLLINREQKLSNLTNREWLYRSAFVMGRGLIGYEIQKVLAVVDWFSRDSQSPIGVIGWGEGGLISLYSGALDSRISSTCVSGYFDSRQDIWKEPIDRNVFGFLEQFGDAELASMVLPRGLIIESARGPEVTFPGGRGAPARTVSPNPERVSSEFKRAQELTAGLNRISNFRLIENNAATGKYLSDATLSAFLHSLIGRSAKLKPNGTQPHSMLTNDFAPDIRHGQQMHELDRHTQSLLRVSHQVRQKNTVDQFDFSSVAAYKASSQAVRKWFRDEIIGYFEQPLLSPNVRIRQFKETGQWKGYEVVLDVYPDVIAYGLLLIPNDIKPGEKRPVVVCQHGLEGRPQHTIGEEGSQHYTAFASQLAKRGFITFAPQNPYIFEDRFRTLQRKSYPLKKTLFSIITAQHVQIVKWLQHLEFIDRDRIAFYGLSYGGKTAMRVPAIITDYCLSICSADFNEWVDKNASTKNTRSYVTTGEYEIFEFDLGSTFNYFEMAALIAPRPFMVERGHFDGVADDWTVAHEYAKVRHLYAARLKIPDQTEIEWFDGPHKINGDRTFEFLHRHLNWPRQESDFP